MLVDEKVHCDECGGELVKIDDERGWQAHRISLSFSTQVPPVVNPKNGYGGSDSKGYEAYKALLCYKCTEELATWVRGKRDKWGTP